jgi:uncharacterized protein YbjT (DUF2867 family)
MKTGSILVIGSTGLLGSTICARAGTSSMRALVRPASRNKVEVLDRAGVEVAVGDLRDQASVVAACRGIDTVVSTATAIQSQHPGDSIQTVDHDGQLSLIEAAEAAGVRRFIYVSFPEQPEEFPLQSAKRAVEQRLRKSRLAFTILQPTLFQEVWLSAALGFDVGEGRARVYGSGEGKISWISVRDVADAVFASIGDEAASGKTWTLGGPESLSPNQVVETFNGLLQRPLATEYVPEATLRAQYESAADPRERSFFALALEYSRGRPVAMEGQPTIPRPTVTVADYARRLIHQHH